MACALLQYNAVEDSQCGFARAIPWDKLVSDVVESTILVPKQWRLEVLNDGWKCMLIMRCKSLAHYSKVLVDAFCLDLTKSKVFAWEIKQCRLSVLGCNRSIFNFVAYRLMGRLSVFS